jgi:hypothetical protein
MEKSIFNEDIFYQVNSRDSPKSDDFYNNIDMNIDKNINVDSLLFTPTKYTNGINTDTYDLNYKLKDINNLLNESEYLPSSLVIDNSFTEKNKITNLDGGNYSERSYSIPILSDSYDDTLSKEKYSDVDTYTHYSNTRSSICIPSNMTYTETNKDSYYKK